MRRELAIELAEQRDALDPRCSAPANVSAEFFAGSVLRLGMSATKPPQLL
jgi:hypothetical protein